MSTLETKKKLIIDTDLFSDVDDASAILLALTHPRANLVALVTNHTSFYTPLAASALVGHYTPPSAAVPAIGVRGPLTRSAFLDTYDYDLGEYASKLAYRWRNLPRAPLAWENEGRDARGAVEVYRTALAAAEDADVTIVSIGFFDNLSKLLASPPDSISPLPGAELVRLKVRELVVMGGEYPSGREFNFFGDSAAASAHVVNTWTSLRLSPVVFIGFELGRTVMTGGPLIAGLSHTPEQDSAADGDERRKRGPSNDPVAMAYLWYTYGKPRESWDPLTVLYAIEGLGGVFEHANETGRNSVDERDGSNAWVDDGGREDQHWLRLKVGSDEAAAVLDGLFLEGAWAAYDWRTAGKLDKE